MGVKKAASSFVAGLVMTLVLVIAVPIVVNQYISGYVSEAVGETSFLFLTSEMLILLIILRCSEKYDYMIFQADRF